LPISLAILSGSRIAHIGIPSKRLFFKYRRCSTNAVTCIKLAP
jgi:hypothetical protein